MGWESHSSVPFQARVGSRSPRRRDRSRGIPVAPQTPPRETHNEFGKDHRNRPIPVFLRDYNGITISRIRRPDYTQGACTARAFETAAFHRGNLPPLWRVRSNQKRLFIHPMNQNFIHNRIAASGQKEPDDIGNLLRHDHSLRS